MTSWLNAHPWHITKMVESYCTKVLSYLPGSVLFQEKYSKLNFNFFQSYLSSKSFQLAVLWLCYTKHFCTLSTHYACFVCIVYRQPQECDNIMFIYTCRKVMYSFGKLINSKETFRQKAMWLVCLRKRIYFQWLNWMGPDLDQEWGKRTQNIKTRILLLTVTASFEF